MRQSHMKPSASDKPCRTNTTKLCDWLEEDNSGIKPYVRSHAPKTQPPKHSKLANTPSHPGHTSCPSVFSHLKPFWPFLIQVLGSSIKSVNYSGLHVQMPSGQRLFIRCAEQQHTDDVNVHMQKEFRKRLGRVVPKIYDEETGYVKLKGSKLVMCMKTMEIVDGELEELIKSSTADHHDLALKLKDLVLRMRRKKCVHGDFHLSNIAYKNTPTGVALRLIDFEYSCIDIDSDSDLWSAWDPKSLEKEIKRRWLAQLRAVDFPLPAGLSRSYDLARIRNKFDDGQFEVLEEDIIDQIRDCQKRLTIPKLHVLAEV